MKRAIYIIMCAALLLSACHEDSDTYTTDASITLCLPVEGTVDVVQYNAVVTNLNSRGKSMLSGSAAGVIYLKDIFRGAYAVSVEGIVRYTDAAGEEHTRQFRAQSDYVAWSGMDGNNVSLEMIFMD